MMRKIKIKKIYPQELKQDSNVSIDRVYSFLPQDEKKAETQFLRSGIINKVVSTFAFLLVGSLSFSWSGWVSAFTNSFGVLMAWLGATIQGADYVNNILRTRYIAKTDLLTEFVSNIKMFLPPETPKDEPKTEVKEKHDITVVDSKQEPKIVDNTMPLMEMNGIIKVEIPKEV